MFSEHPIMRPWRNLKCHEAAFLLWSRCHLKRRDQVHFLGINVCLRTHSGSIYSVIFLSIVTKSLFESITLMGFQPFCNIKGAFWEHNWLWHPSSHAKHVAKHTISCVEPETMPPYLMRKLLIKKQCELNWIVLLIAGFPRAPLPFCWGWSWHSIPWAVRGFVGNGSTAFSFLCGVLHLCFFPVAIQLNRSFAWWCEGRVLCSREFLRPCGISKFL